MQKGMKKLIASILCVLTGASSLGLGSCDGEKVAKHEMPDYSSSTEKFRRWGYTAVYNGWWQTVLPDGTKVSLQNSEETPIAITSKESLQEYKDCGMNVLFINYIYSFNGKNFATSKAKKIMDWAHELDMKCILFENVLYSLSSTNGSLIDPDNANGKTKFSSQEELNAYVYEQIKDVVAHPAYLGFSLKDEPSYLVLQAVGQVYKAIQAAAPNSYAHMNLFPMYNGKSVVSQYCENATELSLAEAYTNYIQTYLDCTGASYIQYDSYPLLGDDTWQTLDEDYILNMQLVAEFAKKNNLVFDHVFQSCAWRGQGKNGQTIPGARKPTELDMRWQVNIGMAMGIKGYAYWNYYPCVNTNGEHHDLTSSFLNRDGSQNPMYGWMKDFHEEMQVTEKALANFNYVTSAVKICKPVPGITKHINGAKQGEFTNLTSHEVNGPGILLVSELYDAERDVYGYYIVNATDSLQKARIEVSLEFSNYKKIQMYYLGYVENNSLKEVCACFVISVASDSF